MLVEFLNTLTVDKKPIMENIRLNIQPQSHQLRLKATYLSEEDKIPVDFIIFNWTSSFDKFKICLIIDGMEKVTKTKFILNISYDIFKRCLKASGNVNGNNIKYNINTLSDFLEIAKEISLGSLSISNKMEIKI